MILIIFIISISIILFISFINSTNEIYTNKNIIPKKYTKKIFVPLTNIYNLAPFQATTLSSNYNIPNYINKYPQNITQKSYHSEWSNGKNQFLCYIDKHLNRKCIWVCPNKYSCVKNI